LAQKGLSVLPNLETEQTRRRHTEEYVARKLGLTQQAYRLRKELASFSVEETLALAEIYDRPVEYLFKEHAIDF
jgi:transcriptional regulator with XRE-family HTH domain